MRNILIIILTSIFISSCSNDDDSLTGINNDGTGGISCLVNGNILKPSGGGLYGNKSATFDYIPNEQVNILRIGFTSRDGGPNRFTSVSMVGYDIDIDNLEGQTINLMAENDNNSFANYSSGEATSASKPGEVYSTNSTQVGELKILYFNREKRIITGEFWYNAVNEFGEVIEITEGRFDMWI